MIQLRMVKENWRCEKCEPGPFNCSQPGGIEHARWGPGGAYHVHVIGPSGQEVRISTETWKPLTPSDQAKYDSKDYKGIKSMCEKLEAGEKKFLDRVNREVFHRGHPSVKQVLRIGMGRSGNKGGSGVRGND